jgi:hypothetical protein
MSGRTRPSRQQHIVDHHVVGLAETELEFVDVGEEDREVVKLRNRLFDVAGTGFIHDTTPHALD